MDNESGVTLSQKTMQWLDRQGTKLHPRAKGMHMPYIDRRTALQREILLKIESQARSEGWSVPFGHILSEATFVGNAMLSVDNFTPYQAVYGPYSTHPS